MNGARALLRLVLSGRVHGDPDGACRFTRRTLNDGGSVPTIKVFNHADIDALILDGTELRGAKQNRMVNVTVIIGKHSETPIPVSCVEQGRWAYRSRGFASSKRTVASKLRNRKAHMVAENLGRTQRAATNQGEVWARVDGYIKPADVQFQGAARSHSRAAMRLFRLRRPEERTDCQPHAEGKSS
jgi:ARG/rhodanese/phosphatase superfamily protein